MIRFSFLDNLRREIAQKKDSIANDRMAWIKRNPYYYNQELKSLKFIIPEGAKVLHIGCGTGYILNELKPEYGLGIDDSKKQIAAAEQSYPHLKFEYQSLEDFDIKENFDYILITTIEDIVDIKAVFDAVKKCSHMHTRIITVYYNYLWHPLVKLAEKTSLKVPQRSHNWFSPNDIHNMMTLCDHEQVSTKSSILFPFNIPLVSYFLNRFIARCPWFRNITLIHISISRILFRDERQYSVSVVIPCRNEAGNIQSAVERIPQMGKHTEIIFCDDKSTDGTADKVKEMMKKYPEKDIKLVAGPGICKARNVWTGFDHAISDILMILDADLTVIPEELPYFYEAISQNRGEFINGSRLVYPMREEAMRIANIAGNKFFSMMFSYILDTRIKDTLCGTKVLWRSDFEKIKKSRGSWGIEDRWGDYELIFGAAKNHLKIIDLPVHYMERTYGETKMTNRLKNGLIMLKMCIVSLLKIKFL